MPSAGRDHRKPGDDRFLVANPFNQPSRRHRRYEIRDEPGRFDQRRLRVVEFENAPQVRQKRVVDNGDEAPYEKERREDGQSPTIGRRRFGRHRDTLIHPRRNWSRHLITSTLLKLNMYEYKL